jgi:UDP-N-acetylglucosamine--dolichyl-phosphate N-acetylglucosaminephosphotransferase
MGIIILSTLGALAYLTGTLWITAVCIMCVAVLLAFLCYNWYPAEVFPGNNFTYAMGALIACIAIFAHLELAAVILFIPYFIDFILPLRKNLKVEAFAKPNPDDSLEMPYDKLYDSTHVALKFLKKFKAKVYENNVVSLILGVEVLIAIGVLIWLK